MIACEDAMAVVAVALVAHVNERGVDNHYVELALLGDDLRQAEVLGRCVNVDVAGLTSDVLAVGDAANRFVVEWAAEAAVHVDGLAVGLSCWIKHLIDQGFNVGLHAVGEVVGCTCEAAFRTAILLPLAEAFDQFGLFVVFHRSMF